MFTKAQLKPRNEYLYLFGVGGLYLFAVARTIIVATHIEITPLRLYLMGLFCLALFTAVLFNRVTRIGALALLVLAALFILWRAELRQAVFWHVNDVALMTMGYLRFHPDLGRTLLWLIVPALGFVTVVFTLHRFSFTVLCVGGAAVVTLSWLSHFARDSFSFFVFLFAFLLILIRKMSGRVDTAALVAPLAMVLIVLANARVPEYSEFFTRRTLREAFEGRFVAIEDFIFELFNPTYFTFASTGFAGGGGRLGGPITLNNAPVMEVYAPGMTYLSGATHNYFTGDRWQTTLQAGDLYTHGMDAGQFEMLENAAALLRGAHFARASDAMAASVLRAQFPEEPSHHLNTRNFFTARMYADEDFAPYGVMIHEDIFPLAFLQDLFLAGGDEAVRQWMNIFLPELDGPVEWIRVDENFIDWREAWREVNQVPPGEVPMLPDGTGRVHYYRHFYLPMEMLSVAIGRNRTGTVFSPPASRDFWFEPSGFDYGPYVTVSATGDVRAPGFMRRGTIYHHRFLHVNPNLEIMADVLHASHAGAYAARTGGLPDVDAEAMYWIFRQATTLVSAPWRNHGELTALLDTFSVQVLAEYADAVRAHFLQVPAITPQRVHDLTHHVIRYEETDFGRVMAIRDFLLTGFPYTLTPVPVPRGVCFVDFFLFEGREGYCTYFASAMAVMARIAGVPARYVEGFIVAGNSRHVNTVTNVTNRMAHAWVEVYLEGFGWLLMEATPPYAAALAQGSVLPPTGALGDDPRFDWGNFYEGEVPYPGFEDAVWPGWDGMDNPGAPAAPGTAFSPTAYAVGFAVGVAALLILGVGGFLFVGRTRFRLALRRAAKMDNNTRAQLFFKGILSISEYYHLPLRTGETTQQYARRAGKRFAFRSDSVFLRDLITLYNRAKYGARPLTDHEAAIMREGYDDMLRLLRNRRVGPWFIYLRYVRKIGAV